MFYISVFNSMPSALALGMVWGIVAVGIYISYEILRFPDLTVESSLTFGGAIAAILISNDFNPILVMIIAMFVGFVAGSITGSLHVFLKVPPILSGILTMSGLYSINMRVLLNTSNISIYGKTTLYTFIDKFMMWGVIDGKQKITILIITFILAMLVVLLHLFFITEIGLVLRALGANKQMVLMQGRNSNLFAPAGTPAAIWSIMT